MFDFSSMSAALNTLAGIIYEDFVSQWVSKNISDRRASNIIKLIVVILGVISVTLVFFVNMLKGIVQVIIYHLNYFIYGRDNLIKFNNS